MVAWWVAARAASSAGNLVAYSAVLKAGQSANLMVDSTADWTAELSVVRMAGKKAAPLVVQRAAWSAANLAVSLVV